MVWTRQFNQQTLLVEAMACFWKHGYHNTSIGDLVSATGVNRASLYATYGDKKGLFLAALEHYAEQQGVVLFSLTPPNATCRQTILAMFEVVLRDLLVDGGDGCLYVNTTLELAPHDPELRQHLHKGFEAFETMFARFLEQGVAKGEFPADLETDDVASELNTLFMGLRVFSRSAADPTRVARTRRQLERILAPPPVPQGE